MSVIQTGQSFSSGDTVTAESLNNLVSSASFISGANGATDDTTISVDGNGRLQIKDGGITGNKLSANFIDDSSLEVTSEGVLQVKAGGIDSSHIDTTSTTNEFNYVSYNTTDTNKVTGIRRLTQTEYDAITTPDANTLYIIV